MSPKHPTTNGQSAPGSTHPPVNGNTTGDDTLVTIAITTCNRADGFLPFAIRSALAQTHRNIEIIVADNASEDHTGDVVKQFTDPRIDYVRHPSNIGPYKNFNFCVNHAQGSYFCLLHDDDMIDPEFVASCLERARGARNHGLIQSGTRVIDGDNNVLHEVPNHGGEGGGTEFVDAWFHHRISPYLCSTMFATEALREIGGFEENNLLCDVRAEFNLALRFGWLTIPEIRASFRNHDEKLTHASKVKAWCLNSVDLLHEMLAAVPPERRDELEKLGKATLARLNYLRASHLASFRSRMLANLMVMQQFGVAHRPPGIRKELLAKVGLAQSTEEKPTP